MGEKSQKVSYRTGKIILQLGWYATFVFQAIMIVLWISSFLSRDSSLYFKINLVTGILIFLLNFYVLRGAWDRVDGTNSSNVLYIITGILMMINLFCLPVGVIYILIPIYIRLKEK